MKHVVYALGTRPEVIRSAAVCRLLQAQHGCHVTVIETGQHYDRRMWAVFLDEMGVDFDRVALDIHESDPVRQTAEIMLRSGEVLRVLDADAVCVFGDTNSSLGVALAAVKAALPLVHLEAGCRSYDLRMQEEHNRRVIDHVSSLLLCLSPTAKANLEREQVPGTVVRIGDPQLDEFIRSSAAASQLPSPLEPPFGFLTLHRAENVDDPKTLAELLLGLVEGAPDLRWLFPVHPRTKQKLPASLPVTLACIEPLTYAETLSALTHAEICVTDSGGLQKDAYWSRTPTVTVRPSTEWVETLVGGRNRLAPNAVALRGAVGAARSGAASLDWHDDEAPYGDGHGSEEAAETISKWLVSPAAVKNDGAGR